MSEDSSHRYKSNRQDFSAKESDVIRLKNGSTKSSPTSLKRKHDERSSSDRYNESTSRSSYDDTRSSDRDSKSYNDSSRSRFADKYENNTKARCEDKSLRSTDKSRFEDKSNENCEEEEEMVTKAPSAPVEAKKPKKEKLSVASVFNVSEDESEEEMPIHARMKMRNIGKDTPTSSGPNSFGKTKQGFTDTVKLWDKDPVKVAQILAEKAEKVDKSG